VEKSKPTDVEFVFDANEDDQIRQFQENVTKFTDSMIVSTSSLSEQIQIWEPKTLAPYEPLFENKFVPGSNTLSVNSNNFIWSCHSQKQIMNVWQWDKKEVALRFALREPLSVFRTHSVSLCAGGDKKGRLYLWAMKNGELLADVESAHFMQITDLDLNDDMVLSAGKDCKLKVWFVSDLIKSSVISKQPYAEFGEHTAEITQVKLIGETRAFSASLDKQFKVYDIPSKMCIKTIQTQSPILNAVLDKSECYMYAGCDNQNIYCYSLEVTPNAQFD
jgi:WD40 repeat protein